jgi:hypothetical protein
LLVLASGSASAARTQADTDCAGISKALRALNTAERSLEHENVDHAPLRSDIAVAADRDAMDVTTVDLSTPLMRLGTRVNSAMQDIFGETENATIENDPDILVSPVAESDDLPTATELPAKPDASGDLNEDIDLPLLQRQMYRTDI